MKFALAPVFVFCATLLGAPPAEASPRSDEILDALKIPELLEIMQVETQMSGEELDESMLDGRGGKGWRETVAQINGDDALEPTLRRAFDDALPDEQESAILSFFTSRQGQQIIDLEVAARKALLDPSVEELSKRNVAALRQSPDARFKQIERFADVNELIDANVVGALNGNAAFLRGLRDGGYPGQARRSDSDILADVWDQEPSLRAETEEWVYSFLTLAYQPLSDDDLEAYIAFSETDAGQALNVALFRAFDGMFVSTSRALGEAVGRVASAKDI